MNSPQRAFDRCQQIVTAGRNAERKQRGLRVSQRVELAAQVRGEFVECLFQTPPFAVQFRNFNRRDFRGGQIGQQVDLRIAVPCGSVQFYGDTPDVGGFARPRLADFDELFEHSACLAPAHKTELSGRFKGHSAVPSGDEAGLAPLDQEQKCQRTEVTVVDYEIPFLNDRADLIQQRALLSMAVFAGNHVVDQHPLLVQQNQGLPGQGSCCRTSQYSQAVVSFAQVVAVENPRSITLQQWPAATLAMVDQLADLTGGMLHERSRRADLDMAELVVQRSNRYRNPAAPHYIRGMYRLLTAAHDLTDQINQSRKQQFPLVLGFCRLVKYSIDFRRGKNVFH